VNALQKTLAIIAFLVLVSQTVRHAYLLWLEPRASVLDKYDRPLKNEITGAASLDELLSRYDPVRKQADAARRELSKDGKPLAYRDERELEPYKSEHALREAITEWETKAKELRELRFYWIVGVALCALGLSIKRLHRWFGLSFLIAGFSEIIYWTSPTFLGANTREFDRLLANKFVLSLASLAFLIIVIWLNGIFAEKRGPSAV